MNQNKSIIRKPSIFERTSDHSLDTDSSDEGTFAEVLISYVFIKRLGNLILDQMNDILLESTFYFFLTPCGKFDLLRQFCVRQLDIFYTLNRCRKSNFPHSLGKIVCATRTEDDFRTRLICKPDLCGNQLFSTLVTDKAQDLANTDSLSDENEDESANNQNESTPSVIKQPCFCSKLPSVTEEDIKKFNQILDLAKSMHIEQNKMESKEERRKTTALFLEKSEMVELVQGSGVMVDAKKVRSIQGMYSKNPRELVRKLMKMILGEDVLRKSSPTGKNGWKPIPDDVYEAVERFVNENAKKRKYQLSQQKYREVLTAMCATLRNPKTGQENSKQYGKAVKLNEKNLENGIEKNQEIEKRQEKDHEIENDLEKEKVKKSEKVREQAEEAEKVNVRKQVEQLKKEEKQLIDKKNEKKAGDQIESGHKKEENYNIKEKNERKDQSSKQRKRKLCDDSQLFQKKKK